MNKIVMDKIKWKFFSIIALMIAFAFLIGGFLVANNIRENKSDIQTSVITSKIINEMHYSGLAEINPDQISKHYNIPNGIIDESSIYMSKSSDNACELACFLLTDRSKFDKLKSIITVHINSKLSGFKSLNPTQYKLLESSKIARKGRYVLVSIGYNVLADEKLFNEILK